MKNPYSIVRFQKGNSIMSMDTIDYYEKDGKLIMEQWGNGYGVEKEVDSIPESIPGYEKYIVEPDK